MNRRHAAPKTAQLQKQYDRSASTKQRSCISRRPLGTLMMLSRRMLTAELVRLERPPTGSTAKDAKSRSAPALAWALGSARTLQPQPAQARPPRPSEHGNEAPRQSSSEAAQGQAPPPQATFATSHQVTSRPAPRPPHEVNPQHKESRATYEGPQAPSKGGGAWDRTYSPCALPLR